MITLQKDCPEHPWQASSIQVQGFHPPKMRRQCSCSPEGTLLIIGTGC